jgi:hypothetical protein
MWELMTGRGKRDDALDDELIDCSTTRPTAPPSAGWRSPRCAAAFFVSEGGPMHSAGDSWTWPETERLMARKLKNSPLWKFVFGIYRGLHGGRAHRELRAVLGPDAKFGPRDVWDRTDLSESRLREIGLKMKEACNIAQHAENRRFEARCAVIAEQRAVIERFMNERDYRARRDAAPPFVEEPWDELLAGDPAEAHARAAWPEMFPKKETA